MNICFYRIFILLIIFLSSAVFASGDEKGKTMSTWQDYKIISTHNIFSRNRIPDSNSASSGSRQISEQELKEENCLILRGITKKADGFTAFIEDSRTNRIKQVLKGEEIGNGKIADITIDFVTYKLGGKAVKVKTGMSMAGQAAGMMPARVSESGIPQEPDFLTYSSVSETDVQAPMDEDSNAILQRLKERRKKELGE